MTNGRRRFTAAAVALVLALGAATGCSTDEPTPRTPGAPREGLPPQIASSGTLTVGTSPPYAPLVFPDEHGKLIGFDVDVVQAIAKKLGLTVAFVETPFPQLLPGILGAKYDMAVRGIFDTRERREQYDMISYFNAGTQWARRASSEIDPNDACGRRVGAESGTVQFTAELPAKSAACTDDGAEPIEIIGFDSLDAAMTALSNSAVDAVSADSPAIGWDVQRSGGTLAAAGSPFDTQPYAFAVINRSMLGPVLQRTVQQLIDDGELKQIAQRWGMQDGVITTSMLDDAVG